MLWNTETEEFNTQNYCIHFLKKANSHSCWSASIASNFRMQWFLPFRRSIPRIMIWCRTPGFNPCFLRLFCNPSKFFSNLNFNSGVSNI